MIAFIKTLSVHCILYIIGIWSEVEIAGCQMIGMCTTKW